MLSTCIHNSVKLLSLLSICINSSFPLAIRYELLFHSILQLLLFCHIKKLSKYTEFKHNELDGSTNVCSLYMTFLILLLFLQ